MMKRSMTTTSIIGRALLALTVAIAAISFTAAPADAQAQPMASLTALPATLAPGDTGNIEVVFDFAGVDVISSEFEITYDPNVVRVQSCTGLQAFLNCGISVAPTASVASLGFNEVNGALTIMVTNGATTRLTYEVLPGATLGTTTPFDLEVTEFIYEGGSGVDVIESGTTVTIDNPQPEPEPEPHNRYRRFLRWLIRFLTRWSSRHHGSW